MPIVQSRRRNSHQLREPARVDSYRSDLKPAGNPRCPDCGSVSYRGAWRKYSDVKDKIQKTLTQSKLQCPACHQLQDKYAQGVVEILGESWHSEKDVMLRTIRNTEKSARSRNDQERILWTQDQHDGGMKVYVSLPELARRIGRELEKTFKGITEYHRSAAEPYLRVRWWSDSAHVGHEPGAPLALKRPSKAKAATSRTLAKSKAFRGRSK